MPSPRLRAHTRPPRSNYTIRLIRPETLTVPRSGDGYAAVTRRGDPSISLSPRLATYPHRPDFFTVFVIDKSNYEM
jgi:hypothetical protein